MKSFIQYLLCRITLVAIQCRGLTNRNKWNYTSLVTPSFEIAPSKRSDFKFIYDQLLEGEKSGAFNPSPKVEAWKIREGKRHQFLTTINFNVMRNDPNPIAQSFLMSARLSNKIIGFVWLKQLQGFPMDGWEIHILCVQLEHQNKGVGKHLLVSAIDFIRQTCGGDVFVRVKKGSDDEAMHRLLRNCMFTVVKDIEFYSGAKMYHLSV